MVRLFEYRSLEKEIITPLRDFIESIGFPERFSTFFRKAKSSDPTPTIRVTTAHPFAVLLFQSMAAPDARPNVANLFPSITVTDSYGTETDETLGREFMEGVLAQADVQKLLNDTDVIVSEEKLRGLLGPNPVTVRRWTINTQRTLDFNIWGENHDLVSIIYDMVESFAVSSLWISADDYQLKGSVTGKRSGDINVEFGTILYGANVTVPMVVQRDVMEIDVNLRYPVRFLNTERLADYKCL